MTKTLVALYDELRDAQAAVNNLIDRGIDTANISLVAYDPEGQYAGYLEDEDVGVEMEGEEEEVSSEGVGAVIGTIAGLMVGIGAVVVPGVGGLIVGGPIATALLGAGVGAATGGLLGALVDLGIPEEEAELYAEGVRRGGHLVIVHAPDPRDDEVMDVLERFGPVDVERRAERWREQGWTEYEEDEELAPYTREEVEREQEYYETYDRDIYPSYEEREPVFREYHESMYADARGGYAKYKPAYLCGYRLGCEPRYWGATWEEVEPEARRRFEAEDEETPWEEVREAARRGWHEVQEIYAEDAYMEFDEDFQAHYETTYATTGTPYLTYRPAYRYGYDLAILPQYEGREWEEIEPEARREWEERGEEGAWEEVREAVRHGWQEITSVFEEDYEDYEEYEPDYRRHYETTYARTGVPYGDYRSAYRYGYDLAMAPEYEGRDWVEVEPEARREWETEHPGTWDRYVEAVRYSWREACE